MSLPPGTRLGSYDVVSFIGAGGMGEVYRAHDPALGRDVAIKVLPRLSGSAGFDTSGDDRRERFEREARAVARLSHPNVVAVHEFGVHEGQPFIAMELLAGQSLRERLNEGPLPVRKATAIAIDIARGLAAAHEQHIVHRDLKPENVFLLKDGQVKILDFGLARAVPPPSGSDASPTVAATDPGMVLGTVGYMAPEQVRGETADARTDLFALGVLLHEMITGRRAFQRGTAAETMTAILREDAPGLAAARPDVPPALERIVEHALEKNPGDRFQTARDVIFALSSLSGSGVIASGSSGAAAAEKAPRQGPRVTRAAIVAIGLALLAAGSIAGWWVGRPAAIDVEPQWDHLTQLTDAAGEEDMPRISADGTTFVYASLSGTAFDIYTQRVGGRRPVLVAGDPARSEMWPAFSPDGTEIAFNAGEGAGGVFVVGATGESERRLTDFGGNPAWSPDGSTIAFATEPVLTPNSRLTTNSSLWVVSASGGAPRRLYAGDAVQPAWSPSGRRLAFWSIAAGQRDLVTISADGDDAVKVTDDAPVDWCPTWSPDGRHLYFASDRGGSMGLWRIPIDEMTGRGTGPPESVLPGTEASVSLPSFSADGRTLVFRSRLHSVNPAAVPLNPVTFRVGAPRMLLERAGVLSPYSVSPDGAWIAMYNLGEHQSDLFLMRSDGSDLRRLTDDVARDILPLWSSDGSRLTFTSNRNGRYAAWSIRPDGSGLSMLAERTDTEIPTTVALAADGTAMFSTGDGRAYLARPPFPVQEDRHESLPNLAVPTGTVVPYIWSPDGRTLAGQLEEPSGAVVGVAVYDLAARRPKVLTDDPWIYSFAFLPDSRQLLYFRLGTSDLVSVDVESGRRRVLQAALPFRVAAAAFAVAPDGRTLYVGAERAEANVWKLERSGTGGTP